MTQFKRSIRLRVFSLLAVAALIITVLYSLMTILVAYVVEDESIEKLLRLEVRYIEQQYKSANKIVSPRLDFMSLYLDFNDAPPEIAKSLQESPSRGEVFTADNKHFHIQHLYLGEEYRAVLVAEVSELLSVTNASSRIIFLFFIVLVIALGLGVWAAYLIAIRVTKPIVALAEEVDSKKLVNLDSKNSCDDQSGIADDEITYLEKTIQSAFDALQKSLVREKDFNRDLSHELRTPLTIMKNTLQLAEQRTISADELRSLSNSLQSIEQIVSALLALARAESLSVQALPLRSKVEESALVILEKYSERQYALNLELDDAFQLNANRELFGLLVNNLIENAFLHASDGKLNILLESSSDSEARLVFENNISVGIPAEHTQAGVKGAHSQGLGLGLYLIKRIIEALGWQYSIEDSKSRYRFILILSHASDSW